MIRVALLCASVAALGAAMLLHDVAWFRRPTLTDRLRPYAPVGGTSGTRPTAPAPRTLRDLLASYAPTLGGSLAHAFGVREDLATRLHRIHAEIDPSAFRTRQLGWTLVAFGAAVLAVLTLAPPPLVGLLALLGGPLLTFLVIEQRVAAASDRWRRRLFLELPVITEQLGMLLAAGYSLGAALNRLAARGEGACARDLRRVCGRIRHGVPEDEALLEWARLERVDALDRLVGVLALNREAADLGRLITEEARAVRRDAHRELIERIERRAEQVWIPVTVATLLPGVIFLAVPFIDALSLFAGG